MTIVDLTVAPPPAVPFGAPSHDPVDDLWRRLQRPFDPAAALAGLTGLPHEASVAVVASALGASAEAGRLLAELPRTIRSLATSTTIHEERCRGELRGPVLWSETMSARSSSFGDPDLYVCATPSRAYDVAENRVLVAALVAVRDAAELAEHAAAASGTPPPEAPVRRALRRNAHDARRFAEHPSLGGVSRSVPTGKDLKRTRAGKKRRQYEPALAVLTRAANPIGPDDVRARLDERVAAQLHVLTGILAGLEAAGVVLPAVRAVADRLHIGGMVFHAGRAGEVHDRSGIVAGPWLLDVPDLPTDTDRATIDATLAARAGDRRPLVVANDADLARAVEQLLPPPASRPARGRPPRS